MGRPPIKVKRTLVAGGGLGSYQWYPDSNYLVYLADQDIDQIIERYAVLPDATDNVKVSTALPDNGDRDVIYFSSA